MPAELEGVNTKKSAIGPFQAEIDIRLVLPIGHLKFVEM
jgi:hypothetical protein